VATPAFPLAVSVAYDDWRKCLPALGDRPSRRRMELCARRHVVTGLRPMPLSAGTQASPVLETKNLTLIIRPLRPWLCLSLRALAAALVCRRSFPFFKSPKPRARHAPTHADRKARALARERTPQRPILVTPWNLAPLSRIRRTVIVTAQFHHRDSPHVRRRCMLCVSCAQNFLTTLPPAAPLVRSCVPTLANIPCCLSLPPIHTLTHSLLSKKSWRSSQGDST
jgi:hypothetical protein